MVSKTLDNEAQSVLRALYDLLDADVRPTLDLLERLLGHSEAMCRASITQLRAAGLVQRGNLNPTMVGLAIALGLPAMEPCKMAGRVVWLRAA